MIWWAWNSSGELGTAPDGSGWGSTRVAQSMSSLLPFPVPFGARDAAGKVCVGATKSRSKQCRTNLVFYDSVLRVETSCLATRVRWMEKDAKTTAILLDCLRDILHTKGVVPFDRGLVTGRYIENRFYLMEATRGIVFPRYKWWLPYQIHGWSHVISLLIAYETWFPKSLVAEPDTRLPVDTLPDDPDRIRVPVRMGGDHREWVGEMLALRQSAEVQVVLAGA